MSGRRRRLSGPCVKERLKRHIERPVVVVSPVVNIGMGRIGDDRVAEAREAVGVGPGDIAA
jgi:hypothetical protein